MLPSGISALLTIVFGLAVPGAMALFTIMMWQTFARDRERLDRARARTPKLLPGRIALFGKVEPLDENMSSPVSMELTQNGSESTYKTKSGSRITNTTWKETSRTTKARPFGLLLENGELIEVRADERTMLHDMLTSATFPNLRMRICRAELAYGEEVLVQGELVIEENSANSGPFRGSAKQRYVLRPRWRSALHISSATLTRSLQGYVKIYRFFFFATLVLTAIAHFFAFDSFWEVRRLNEESLIAVVLTPFVYGLMAVAFRRFKPWYAVERTNHSGSGKIGSDTAKNAGLTPSP